MGEWSGKRWHPYLDEEAQERRDQILDHLKQNYDGPTHFVKEKLKEEQALDIQERIRRKEQNLKQKEEELEKLKRIKSERDTQDKLRDKRELLKEKQKKLRKIARKETKSEEEVREEVLENMREKAESSPKISDVEEWINSSRTQERIRRQVESRIESDFDVDELVETVERLQSQVAELNGGEEDYFMDLETVEEVKA